MSQLIFSSLVLSTGLLFMSMNHPLAMGLVLLTQTSLIAVLTGLMSLNFWFSYILFLVFLGGMLVLFVYVTSLASNEMFSMSFKVVVVWSLMIFVLMTLMFWCDPLCWLNNYTNENSLSLFTQSDMLDSLLFKLYSSYSSMLTVILISYLFLALLAVVNITSIFKGPLRSTID